jgi:hypothetical protein
MYHPPSMVPFHSVAFVSISVQGILAVRALMC